MKSILILSIYILFFSNSGFSQTQRDQFYKLVNENDTLGQKNLLEQWSRDTPADPELLVAYFNYYMFKSRQERSVSTDNEGGNFIDRSPDGSMDTTEYVYKEIYYNTEVLKKGFVYLDKGIHAFPDRLDMRFGKIYMLENISNYEDFTSEIINTIERSAINKNQWTWTDNKPLDQPKEFMLSSVMDYVYQLYDTNDDALLPNMIKIGDTVLKYYPDHLSSLSNNAIAYTILKDYKKALELLLKAEKLSGQDFVVLSNIAQVYRESGDIPNAIKYYELTLKYGDESAQDFAREQLELLKKQD